MNRYLVFVIGILFVTLSVVWSMYTKQKEEYRRVENNQHVLLSDVQYYKIRDSLSAASVQRLQFTNREFEKYRGETTRLIEDLNVKLKRALSVSISGIETKYEIITEVKDSIVYRDAPVSVQYLGFKNAYLEFSGIIKDKKFIGEAISRDTIVQVIHRVPKKIWFIRYGTKAIKQEIVSKNPYSRIIYSEYIQFKR